MNNKSPLFNSGAVLVCLLCLFITRQAEAVNLHVYDVDFSEIPNEKGVAEIIGGLSDIARDSGLEVTAEKDCVRLCIYTDNMFRVSRAELSGEAQASLNSLGKRLRVYAPSHILIEGYTPDEPTNTPQFPNNWYLSSARAISVGMVFINESGFNAKRITALGRGSADLPGKGKNGRIEIIVTP